MILDVIDSGIDLIKRFVPDTNAQQQAEREFKSIILSKEHELKIQQLEINKIEAQHTSLFVSGWRPALGWAGVAAIVYSYVLLPFISFIAVVGFGYKGTIPTLELEVIMSILGTMLGAVGVRHFDKKAILRKK